ncbi:RDD family protein [Microbulbifer sediminum]|uniref:RDD family protein n=1 Tax=Microbulbifer sediminum TaxID=2904250 RepID=UPI001F392C74|nr:RDD family protein [Microbulbifer sediminum]
MNPWQVLDIAPSGDPRAIKRAYAKKLKQTRPDEKPEEFQQLHAAYKQALGLAAQKTDATAGEIHGGTAPLAAPGQEAGSDTGVTSRGASLPETPIMPDTAVTEPGQGAAPAHQSPTGPTSEPDQPDAPGSADTGDAELQRNARIDEYHRVLARVDSTLEHRQRVNDQASWQFLAESPFILEEEYNWNLGLGVFQRVAQYSAAVASAAQRYTDRPGIDIRLLQYFDSLFAWSEDPAYLSEHFDAVLVDAVLPRLDEYAARAGDPQRGLRGGRKLVLERATPEEERFPEYYFGSFLARAFAVLLDVFLVYVALGVITSAVLIKHGASEGDASSTALMVSVGGYLLLAWLAESSRWQATPGKYLLGYRVTNRQFRRMGYAHGLWRIVSFTLTLPLYWLAWLVNCFLNGNLLHDRLSRSYVINWRKSREEAGG